ncbi:MAG TPA: type II secretion system protein [Candidatus Ozemobacteraceae bacterium]|nr:type II secretion system protein [Candidatus Ozemobacteraceae bacterium]HQG27504.1 type II secretion system protein [Candidatus Ozemobacteraceae bacterium]
MNKKNAFTITEVMIAVLVVAACLSPIFFIFSRGAAGTQQTRDEVLAYTYATELLDYALSKSFDSPFLAPGTRDANALEVTQADGSSFVLKADERFERKLSVVIPSVPATVPFTYKVLIAEVAWKTAQVKRNISMSCMMYRNR